MKYLNLLFLIFIWCSALRGFSQKKDINEYPEIGKPMSYFELNNVYYYNKEGITLNSFKGKYLILDFGHKHCAACFASYPKIKSLLNNVQKDIVNKLIFFLILKQDNENEIRPVYEKYRNKYNLTFPVAYDSVLFNRVVPRGAPHYVWIDNKGIVKAITGYSDLTEKNIISFIKGETFDYIDKSAKTLYASIEKQHSNINQFSNPDFIFYSSIEQAGETEQAKLINSISSAIKSSQAILLRRVDLGMFYRLAYIDRFFLTPKDSLYSIYHQDPILEIKDSSFFATKNQIRPKNLNYTLKLPYLNSKNVEYIQGIIQNDLKKAFGYQVSIEKRKMPVLFLESNETARKLLPSKGGKAEMIYMADGIAGIKYINQPIEKFIYALSTRYWYPRIPIIDHTMINSNIDLNFEALFTDNNDIDRELKKHGLALVKGEQEFKVIVIRDPKP